VYRVDRVNLNLCRTRACILFQDVNYEYRICLQGLVKVKLSLWLTNQALCQEDVWPWHKFKVSGQLHAPAAISSGGKTLIPTGQEAGWIPEPV
jgi:hypothetical protein